MGRLHRPRAPRAAASDRFTGNYSASGSQSQQAEYLVNGAFSGIPGTISTAQNARQT
jgi:hypothetical protein